ncbi:MAG TPA: hypothetical protein VF460_12905 [Burkholderiales bacterium]
MKERNAKPSRNAGVETELADEKFDFPTQAAVDAGAEGEGDQRRRIEALAYLKAEREIRQADGQAEGDSSDLKSAR